VHRCSKAYAPSNILIRRVRAAGPRWRTAGELLALSFALAAAARGLATVVAAGAWGELYLVVLTLVWDAIKFGCLGLSIVLGRAWSLIRPVSKEVWS
jgi:hypothetical protein